MSGPRSIARASLSLLPWQIAVRGVEASLPIALSAWFGRGDATDAYYLAWAVFSLGGALLASPFRDSAVVPVLTELKVHEPGALPVVRGSLFAHAVALGGAAAAGVGSLAACFFALRSGGDARAAALAMVLPFALYLPAQALRAFFASMLNAEHRYAWPTIAGGAGAAVTLGTIAALRGALSIVAVPCGWLAGEVVAAGVLFGAVRAARLGIRPTFARPRPVRLIGRLVASEVGGDVVTRLNPIIDQLMAAAVGVTGGGTMLKLSADVATVPTSLLQSALLPVLLTHLSVDFAARDVARLRSSLRRALASVVGILAAAGVALAAVRGPLLRLLFAHGFMDAAAVERIARILPYHLVGLAPFGALLVLARAHVAVQNSRIMLGVGALNAALNAALDLALLPALGLEGIALATSFTHAVVAVVFYARLEPRLAALGAAPGGLETAP